MNLKMAVAAVAALVGTLTACSHSSSTAGSATSTGPAVSTAAAAAGQVATTSDLAKAARCTGYKLDSDNDELYTKEHGTCRAAGAEIDLYTFASDADRDHWYAAAKSFGGNYGEGHGWIITGDTTAPVTTATKAAGGTVL